MKFLQKLSEKTGLTKTEIKIIAFLAVVFLIGITIKSLNWEVEESSENKFDYTSTDSVFYSTNKTKNETIENKVIDSKLESSDFNKSNFNANIKKQELALKSLDLNKASLEQLTMLPGIGSKTAENILTYRKANSKFENIEELLNVKGIGELKLEKIKKYIFIR